MEGHCFAMHLAAWPRVSPPIPQVPMVQAVEKVIDIPMIGKTVTGRLGFLTFEVF